MEDAGNVGGNMNMHTQKLTTLRPQKVFGNALVIAVALFVLSCAQWSFAQQSQPKTFDSAAQASQALYEAVQKNDGQAMQAILGTGPELTSCGDAAQDKIDRERFAQKYREMHRLVRDPDGYLILYIGAENWPFPIPLVEETGKWHFDSSIGAQEVMARRVGEDETIAIKICQAVVATNRRELKGASSDPIDDYAHHLVADGANGALPEKELFHGYRFRVVPQNSGGAILVAYPAKYRVTGVMTFTVIGNGPVYEKDLGTQTATLAQQIQGKPSGDWRAVLMTENSSGN